MPTILLHTCCGPCSTYVVKTLRQQDFDVTGFWYNPNIHPFQEHQLRLEAIKAFSDKVSLPMIFSEGYDMVEYFRLVAGHEHEGDRCVRCYRLRLTRIARTAKEKGIESFSTTLLISPYQRHDLLREVGEKVAEETGVRFYYHDFRAGFSESRRMAREIGLYLQKYCGCVYSEYERYGKVKV